MKSNVFELLKKNEMGCSEMMSEQNEKKLKVPISSFQIHNI